MLFLLNHSPLTHSSLRSCLRVAPPAAALLFYEDGVLGVAAGGAVAPLLAEALRTHPVYALGPDLAARGVRQVLDGVQVIDYDGFVALVEQHPVLPWG